MASVIKSHIFLQVNGREASQQVQHVSQSVRRFTQETTAGFNRTQQVAQQAVFAVDDFFAAFSTGGVSGGLRGAGNNLTLIASQLGGIKTQLLAIGVISAGQLLAKYFIDAKDESKTVEDRIGKIRDNLDFLNKSHQSQFAFFEELRDLGPRTGINDVRDAERQRRSLHNDRITQQQNIVETERQIESIRRLRGEAQKTVDSRSWKRLLGSKIPFSGIAPPGFKEEASSAKEYLESTKDSVQELQKRVSAVSQELRLTDQLIEQQDKLIAKARALASGGVAPAVPGDRFGLFGGGTFAQNLATKLQTGGGLRAFDPFRFFGSLPSANAFGSSGAVSAINQAQIGPKNVQDAQLRELQAANRNLGDINRNLGNKLHSLVEVPL